MRFCSLFKPEYVYRPRQLLRRACLTSRRIAQDECLVALPWGLQLSVNPHELIGNCIVRLGVYDLVVSEALWRLADGGETVLDVGSNIGYMASILARRTGAAGRVFCFEAHPEICARLRRNVARWGLPVAVRHVALSDAEGSAELRVPRHFAGNQGTASLALPDDGTQAIAVPAATLDGLELPGGPIGVMKLDVEGHEPAVLRGAAGRLTSGEIRDIVFEDLGAYPTEATELLARSGYRLYALSRRFVGPYLAPPASGRRGADPPSYLATRDPLRAERRFARRGWSVLRSRGPR